MIFTIVSLFLIVYSFLDFKKAFIFYLGFKCFLNTDIILVFIPGFPRLTTILFFDSFFFMMYFLQFRKYYKINKKFPFSIAFILIAISWLLSGIFGITGFGEEMTRVVSNVFSELLFMYLIWELIDTEKDFERITNMLIVIFLVASVYGLIELLIKNNPLANWEYAIAKDQSRAVNYTYLNISDPRGYRIKSIFYHAIGGGLNWGVYILWILVGTIKYELTTRHKLVSYIVVMLSFLCVLASKSRGPLLFLVIGLVGVMDLKKKSFWRILMVSIASVLIVYTVFDFDINIFRSIFNQKSQKIVQGSNSTIRLRQLEAAIDLMKSHFWFGAGAKFKELLEGSSLVKKLGGQESVWFFIIPCYGMVGVLVELILILYSTIIIPKRYHCVSAAFLSLGYWLTYSLTSLPGFLVYLYYLLYFFMIKNQENLDENGMRERLIA